MYYAAKLRRDGDQWLVTFRDIPEAMTSGATREEALGLASDALLTAMDFYFEDQRAVPEPSKPRRGEALVGLPASTAAKVLLLNEMVSQHVRASTLARRMGTTPQEMNRIVDLRHATKIDTVAHALNALGKKLELRVS